MKKKSYKSTKKYPYYLITICFLFNIIACDSPPEHKVSEASVDTSSFNFTNFGQQYLNQIPSDATIKKYDANRFCMIAGKILSEDGKPLPSVRVAIHAHPEYGSTLTNEKGNYSIPSEGGKQLTVRYTKEGYMTIDRNIDAPVQDWVRAPSITMLEKDTKSTEVNLEETSIHTSSITKDERGERSATLVFDKGTTVTVTGKDGTKRDLTNMKIRATEFRVSDSMPSDLPPTSAYTYCADYTVDGVNDGEKVEFGKPIVTYVENFLNFDVGEAVPMGYYDRNKSKWVGAKNGVVVKLLDTDGDNKIDALDSNGNDKPNDLDGDGDFKNEIAGIIDDPQYIAGQTYWRATIEHFTPWDYNWPYGPPPNATPPGDPKVDTNDKKVSDCKSNINSSVTDKTRIYRKSIPIAGTNLSLNYSSRRTKGYKHNIRVDIPAPPENAQLLVKLEIAGKNIDRKLTDNNTRKTMYPVDFIWDGTDVDGNIVVGKVKAKLSVGYSYPGTYYKASEDFENAWAQVGVVTPPKPVSASASSQRRGSGTSASRGSGSRGGAMVSPAINNILDERDTREEVVLWKDTDITLNIEPKVNALDSIANGWTLSNHNKAYNNLIIKGDGTYQQAISIEDHGVIRTIAGGGSTDISKDRRNATEVKLSNPQKIRVDLHGNKFFIENNRILKLDSSGLISVVAGTGEKGFSGDGGPAIEAELNNPKGLDIDDNGNIYIADYENVRIRKIDNEGIITTVAGGGNEYRLTAKPHKAIDARIHYPSAVEVDNKGNLFFIDRDYIFKVDTNGFMTTIAGASGYVGSPTGRPALGFLLRSPVELETDTQDNIYVLLGSEKGKVLKIKSDGIIVDIDTLNAKGKPLSLRFPRDISLDKRGNIFIADTNHHTIIKINNSNFVTTIVGGGSDKSSNHATETTLNAPSGVAVDVHGNLFIIESGTNLVKEVTPPPFITRYGLNNKQFIHKKPNNLADIYDHNGKHIKTIDLETQNTLNSFIYKNNSVIESVNQFGESVKITRDNKGYPISITAPNGQETHLKLDSKGNLKSVRYEDNSTHTFEYDENSLMTRNTDQNNNSFTLNFDENGRFTKGIDANGGEWTFEKNKVLKSGRQIATKLYTKYKKTNPENNVQITEDSTTKNGNINSTVTLATGDEIKLKTSKDRKKVEVNFDKTITKYKYELDHESGKKTLTEKTTTQPIRDSNGKNLTQKIKYETNYTSSAVNLSEKQQKISLNENVTSINTNYQNGNIEIITPEGRVLKSTYDKATRLTSSLTTGTLEPVNFSYDNKGRLISSSQGTGDSERKVALEYDDNVRGNLSKIIDSRGKETQFTYDVMDRVTSATYPDGTSVRFSYDLNGNMTKLITPSSNEFRFETNALDQPSRTLSPMNKSTSYKYNKNRDLIKVTKPSGATIENTYIKDRLSSTKTPEGTTQYKYLFANKLKSITRGDESIDYTYNGTLLTNISQKGVLKQNISYTYNNDFDITQSFYASKSTAYNYDKDGLLIKSGDFELTRHKENAYVTHLSDSNLSQEREYNRYGELSKLSDNTFSYDLTKRDKSGAITQKTETINGKTTTCDYTFDDNGRLTKVQKDGQTVESYHYDKNGNRKQAVVYAKTVQGSFNQEDQTINYGENKYKYNTDGYLTTKMTTKGQTTYQYGSLGELLSVKLPSNKTISYLHNARNQRVAKKVNGIIVEKYLWKNLTTLLAIYDKDDNLIQRFEYVDQRVPISMLYKNRKYYLHYDQVGSLRAISDENHKTVKTISYDTYGNVLEETNVGVNLSVPFGFAGGLYDQDTKLTRFGYRDYDAYTGKWTAKDPIGFAGGDANLYGYVLGNPVNFMDPLGRSIQDVIEAGVFIGVGAGIAAIASAPVAVGIGVGTVGYAAYSYLKFGIAVHFQMKINMIRNDTMDRALKCKDYTQYKELRKKNIIETSEVIKSAVTLPGTSLTGDIPTSLTDQVVGDAMREIFGEGKL